MTILALDLSEFKTAGWTYTVCSEIRGAASVQFATVTTGKPEFTTLIAESRSLLRSIPATGRTDWTMKNRDCVIAVQTQV